MQGIPSTIEEHCTLPGLAADSVYAGCKQVCCLWIYALISDHPNGVMSGLLLHNLQVDIYSFGVLLWELVTATPPMRGRLRPIKVCFSVATAAYQHMR